MQVASLFISNYMNIYFSLFELVSVYFSLFELFLFYFGIFQLIWKLVSAYLAEK